MAADLASRCAVAIMAKAPRPGHVKTRLQALLTPDEAAGLGTAFLRDTAENLAAAAASAPIAPFVAYAPRGQEARFDGLLPPGTELLLADGSDGEAEGVDGFGRVLLEAVRAMLGMGFAAACVLAADSPTLPTAEIARAATLLLDGEHDAVLGASEDGGYWVLGLRRPVATAFARIRWSGEHACADTRARLAEAGMRTAELATWFDVDDPASLRRLLRAGEGGYAAPHTRAALDRMDLPARLWTAA